MKTFRLIAGLLFLAVCGRAVAMDGFLKQSTAVNVTVTMTDTSDHIAGKTGLTLTIYASKAGATPALITPTVTEIDSTHTPGVYKLAFTTSHTDTLGELKLHVTGTGADPIDPVWQVVAFDLNTALASQTVGTATNLTNAPTAGDFTATMKTSLNAATPAVTVSDKTGFALTSAYDAAKTAAQAGDVMKVSSGTGANQISLASGLVTVGTNNDKTGYTASTVSDKTGYALTSAYDPAKTAAQAGDAMALTTGERTSVAAAIWNALTSGMSTTGSIGKLLADDVDAAISTRLATAGYTAPLDAAGTRSAVGLASANLDTQFDGLPTASETATAVWASGTRTLTSFGTLVSDIWAAVADSPGVTTLLASMTKVKAAVYDSATVSGSVITLSNGATQTVTGTGRVTAP